MDWAAKREKAEAKLAKVGFRGTITFETAALDVDPTTQTLNVWVLPKSRNVDEKGGNATVTVLVTTSERAIEGGKLTFEGKSYQINKVDQIGVGTSRLLSEVVASEL